jgi:hypothetical protein
MKVDINRSVQENVKNAVEDMAENIRKEKLNICGGGVLDHCYNFASAAGKYVYSDTLYTGDHYYYLGKQATTGDWVKVTDTNDCIWVAKVCTLIKDGTYPLTNKDIVFRNLKFEVSSDAVPKVTISFAIAPAPKRGVKAKDIEKDVFYFQTTITQNLIIQK